MGEDSSLAPGDRNRRDVYEVPDSEKDPEIKKPRWKTPPDISRAATRGKKGTEDKCQQSISTSSNINQRRCQRCLSPIVVPDSEDLNFQDASDDDELLNPDSEKAASESEVNEGSIIDRPESPDQFDDLLSKPRRRPKSMNGSSVLPR